MQVEEVSYPMVVTPAPSSPEESVVGTSVPKDLLRLWQGRLSSRRMNDAEQLAAATFAAATTTTTNRPSWWQQQPDNDEGMETVRLCGMIQDIGETEFLPIAAKNSNTNNNSFVERLPITVVTDWGKEYNKHQDDDDVMEQASKRVCRQRDRPLPTTLIMYVYYPSQEQAAAPIRNELHLHQLVEWIAVKDRPQQQPDAVSSDHGEIMVDVNSFLHPNFSLLSTWSEDSSSSCISATNNHDWKLPRLHVLAYCLQTVDDLYLRNSHNYIIPPPPPPPPQQQQQPLMDTAQAVLFLSEALHLPRPVATALWLTLLSRAEPSRGSHTTTTTITSTLLGCASIQFVLPHDDALVQRFVSCLTALLEPALVTGAWQTWQASHLQAVPRLAQRHGRIARHAWQLPAGSTILVQNDKKHEATATTTGSCWATAVLPSLVGQHQMPLLCEACQQIPLAADWRFVVVSTPRGRPALPCTATVDLPCWTPGFTAPPPAVHARWARTLASRRAATPSVSLSVAVRHRAPDDFCRLRQARASSTCPDEAAFHRWLTHARLLARSRGSATADIVDWEQALQLDQALNAQGRF